MDKLSFRQANRRIEALRNALKNSTVKSGWIRYMRNTLGMKLKDLARLTGLSSQTITEMEQREIDGRVTLSSLRRMAEAMECQLVYALIPNTSIKELIEKRAFEKAKLILSTADTHMVLEDQKVQVDKNERIRVLAQKLIEKGEVW